MSLKNQGFITQQGLRQLDNYKYVSGGYTKLDQLMTPYWNWVISYIPQTVAPNLLTFIGWLCVILSQVIMLIYSVSLDGNIPSWCFFVASIALFAYQTLDSIDGKQARRTKSSSPLGQLFDHGCDSFSIGFFVLGVCHAAKISGFPAVALLTGTQFVFWTSTWVQHHTGILNTKVGQLGVTQGQLLVVLIHLITGIFGQNLWGFKLSTVLYFIQLPASLQNISFISFFAGVLGFLLIGFCFFSILWTIFANENTQNQNQASKNKKHSKFDMIKQHSTLLIIFIIQFLWCDFKIFKQYQGLILINFGAFVSLLVSKIIISSVTKMKLQILHDEITYFVFFTIIMTIFDIIGQYQGMKFAFIMCLIINLMRIGMFIKGVIEQLANHLGIYCFSLEKKERIKQKVFF